MALAYHDEGGAYGTVAHCKFGVIVLASWDYSLMSEPAACNLSMGIANSFKVTRVHRSLLVAILYLSLETRSSLQLGFGR